MSPPPQRCRILFRVKNLLTAGVDCIAFPEESEANRYAVCQNLALLHDLGHMKELDGSILSALKEHAWKQAQTLLLLFMEHLAIPYVKQYYVESAVTEANHNTPSKVQRIDPLFLRVCRWINRLNQGVAASF